MQREPDLTINDASIELAASTSTIWKLIRDGWLETYMLGRARRIRRDSLDAYKQVNRVEVGAGTKSTDMNEERVE